MKFRYYIADPENFDVQGTDDEGLARTLAGSLEYMVIDTETGLMLTECSTDPVDIGKFAF